MYVDQMMDHFNGNNLPMFRQRVCVYDKFRNRNKDTDVMFFYTGNESPLDLYVNNTGLMWELGESIGATLVFAEHRYFGESMPQLQGTKNCMSYLTSAQALADYARLVPIIRDRLGMRVDTRVVAFGGSYGGMLSAWFRLRYPHICNAGAVAASAPIWGFPSSHPELDGSYRAITNGAEDAQGNKDPQCIDSFLAAWAIIHVLMNQDSHTSSFLSRALGVCSPVGDVQAIIEGFQDVLFLLAESNFPYPSDYIVFATTNKRGAKLPAWPMREACNFVKNNAITITGNRTAVKYDIEIDNSLHISVDWDTATTTDPLDDFMASPAIQASLHGIRQMYGMLYNISGDVPCFNFNRATVDTPIEQHIDSQDVCQLDSIEPSDGWSVIVCNEGMNLVQDLVRGIGHDMYWPPSIPRNPPSYHQLILDADRMGGCKDFRARGLFGVTDDDKLLDTFGEWAFDQYMGRDIGRYATNIVFSNGLYDPWSMAGVRVSLSSSVKAVLLPEGGHHTDLMFSNKDDTVSITKARAEEARFIKSWIRTSLIEFDTVDAIQ